MQLSFDDGAELLCALFFGVGFARRRVGFVVEAAFLDTVLFPFCGRSHHKQERKDGRHNHQISRARRDRHAQRAWGGVGRDSFPKSASFWSSERRVLPARAGSHTTIGKTASSSRTSRPGVASETAITSFRRRDAPECRGQTEIDHLRIPIERRNRRVGRKSQGASWGVKGRDQSDASLSRSRDGDCHA